MCYSTTNFISINIKYIMPVCIKTSSKNRKERICRVKLKITRNLESKHMYLLSNLLMLHQFACIL